MRAVLLRRMAVLGVCAVGVAALYLVPGLTTTTSTITREVVPQPLATVSPVAEPEVAFASTAARAPARTGRTGDADPPAAVTGLAVHAVRTDWFRIGWTPTDDTDTVRYRVWLNGYLVADTAETTAELAWFNDDNTQQVVAVRAVDPAGNQSPRSAVLVLTRPDAGPADVVG